MICRIDASICLLDFAVDIDVEIRVIFLVLLWQLVIYKILPNINFRMIRNRREGKGGH